MLLKNNHQASREGPELLKYYPVKILVNKVFQTWHLIGWQHSRQPIRNHIRKPMPLTAEWLEAQPLANPNLCYNDCLLTTSFYLFFINHILGVFLQGQALSNMYHVTSKRPIHVVLTNTISINWKPYYCERRVKCVRFNVATLMRGLHQCAVCWAAPSVPAVVTNGRSQGAHTSSDLGLLQSSHICFTRWW